MNIPITLPSPFLCAGCGEQNLTDGDLCRLCEAEHAPDFIAWLESSAEVDRERRAADPYPTPCARSIR